MSTTSLLKGEDEINNKPLLLTQIWNDDIKTCYTSLDNYEFIYFLTISIWTELWVKIEYIIGNPKLKYYATPYFPKRDFFSHEGSDISVNNVAFSSLKYAIGVHFINAWNVSKKKKKERKKLKQNQDTTAKGFEEKALTI